MSGARQGERAGALRRYKPYPAYKDTGVEWLGEIPAGWEIARISELMTLVNGYPFDSEYFVRGDGVPLVRIRDLSSTETEVNYTGPVIAEAWIETGDVIIGMDGDFNVARWRGPRALLNQRMCCLRPRSGTDAGFVTYLLPDPLKVINDLTYSTTVKHLSSNDVRKIRLGAPPEPEQRAIAAFLDRETTRIDALVAKKERLIELLQEQRTALITRAVTKGLDPAVPMKDSGVEWLGEIPAGWEVKRLKYVAPARISKVDVKPDDAVYVGLEHVESWTGRLLLDNQPDTVDSVVSSFRAGDVLFGKLRPYLAKVARPDFDGVCTSEILPLRPVPEASQSYLTYELLNAPYIRWLDSLTYGTKMPRVSPDQVASSCVALPPLSEQRAIADFLDGETARIDALVTKVREAIERLKELRTALISAAVTGKIDVREEVA